MTTPRTKRCPYCNGDGGASTGMSWLRCTDCDGTGRVCTLCWLSPMICECAPSRFDDDPSPADPPVTQPF